MGNLKWLLVGLAALIVLFLITQSMQSKYTTRTDRVFPEDTSKIHKIILQAGEDQLVLTKEDTSWTLVDHDSLTLRPDRLQGLFDRVFIVRKETLVSVNSEKWSNFSIDHTTGTHIRLYDREGDLITHAVFGRSMSDWAHNYVRVGDRPEVYLTDDSVIYLLTPRPTYFGEAPKPPEPDTTGVIPVGPSGPE